MQVSTLSIHDDDNNMQTITTDLLTHCNAQTNSWNCIAFIKNKVLPTRMYIKILHTAWLVSKANSLAPQARVC